jgi:hypothetical protein
MLRLLFPTVAAALLPLVVTAGSEYDEAARDFERLFSWTFDVSMGNDRTLENVYSADASTDRCILTHTTTSLVDGSAGQVEVITIDLSTVDRATIGEYSLQYEYTNDPPFSWSVFMCSIPDDHIDPRRSAFFMARSVLRDIRNGVRPC